MGDLVGTVFNALAGLVAGIANAAVSAARGVVDTITSVVPHDMLPLVVIGAAIVLFVIFVRR
jgi:hypothetical protein